jgi:hypothetical protein
MSSVENDKFNNYWLRLRLRDRAMAIPAKCVYWQRAKTFNAVEDLIWARIRACDRILDYGSGDQSLRTKFVAAGYRGQYDTFDVSPEFETTWRRHEDIRGTFDAVVCLEVLEHMPLEEGLALRKRLADFVHPGGWLILSTPNPACIVSPFSRDETHQHVYPLHDLLTFAIAAGFEPQAWRVKLLPDRVTPTTRLRLLLQRILCYAIGADRADGLLVIARRSSATS